MRKDSHENSPIFFIVVHNYIVNQENGVSYWVDDLKGVGTDLSQLKETWNEDGLAILGAGESHTTNLFDMRSVCHHDGKGWVDDEGEEFKP